MKNGQFTFFVIATIVIIGLLFCILSRLTSINSKLLYLNDTAINIGDDIKDARKTLINIDDNTYKSKY